MWPMGCLFKPSRGVLHYGMLHASEKTLKDQSVACNLDIFYQNVRGLRTKAREFFANVISPSFPIFVISEIWLCSEISSSDFFSPPYKVFRSDRDFSGVKPKSCGLLIAVDRLLRCVRRNDIEGVQESIWLEVSLARCEKLLIGTFCVPPNISHLLFDEVITSTESVSSSYSKHKVILLGDFNTRRIDWNTLTYSYYNQYIENKCSLLFDFLSFCSLQQHNLIDHSCGNV